MRQVVPEALEEKFRRAVPGASGVRSLKVA
jgi:hypothetical protein